MRVLAVAVLCCAPALLSNHPSLLAQSNAAPAAAARSDQQDEGRPTLRHQRESKVVTGTPAGSAIPAAATTAGPTVAPGLPLPATGQVWALDTFEEKPELVHLLFFPTLVDRHSASNFAKANLAPFVAKMKHTVEIRGTRSDVRLHSPRPVIYIRSAPAYSEDAAVDLTAEPTTGDWTLVELKVLEETRLVMTLKSTQVTGHISRSVAEIEVLREHLADSNWQKITPTAPLAPGEYGLILLPKGRALFQARVYDFAIDPKAPQNKAIAVPNIGGTH